MKLLIPIVALLFASFQAQAQMRPKEIENFKCGADSYGTTLSLQVGGARYGDAISIDLTDDEARKLLQPSEHSMKTWEQKLVGSLQIGSCKRGSGQELVVCDLKPMGGLKPWALVDLSFFTEQEFAPGVTQGARITRRMDLNDLVIRVTQVGDQAHLTLKATVDDGVDHAKVVTLDKNVGTLKQDWFMCKFE